MEIRHKEWVDSIVRVRGDTENRHSLLRLDKNERVTPFSNKFWNTVYGKIKQEHVLAYPEPERLYAKLSKFHGCSIDNLVLTAGSDAAICNGFDLCVKPGDSVVTLRPTFAMVEVYCELHKAEKRLISYNSDLSLDIDYLLSSIDDNVSLIVLANPNSPTGTVIDMAGVEKVIQHARRFGAVVLIDEAYHGFCKDTCISLVKKYLNVMVVRTFSKACGLAGLRIGYIIASALLAPLLYKFRPMYEVNSISLLFAEAILDNWDEVTSYIEETIRGKKYLIEELKRLNFSYVDTSTNFIHIDFKEKKELALQEFEKEGIKVRGGLPIKGYENYLRITLAPKVAMKKLIKVMEVL